MRRAMIIVYAALFAVLGCLFWAGRAGAAATGPVTKAEGQEAIRRFANLELIHFPGSTYALSACRRESSGWPASGALVWCEITWHYDPPRVDPIFGEYEESEFRITALRRTQRPCIRVWESWDSELRCFRLDH